jgi:hypothetical protein
VVWPSCRRSFCTLALIAYFAALQDCWVVVHGRVLDVTPLLRELSGSAAEALLTSAGSRVASSWFDAATLEPLTARDSATGLLVPVAPPGCPGVAPPEPSTGADSTGPEWWRDERLVVGSLTAALHRVVVLNTLTGQRHVLDAAAEDTVGRLKERFAGVNAHCRSYTWKALLGGAMTELRDDATLGENGVPFTDVGALEDAGLDGEEEGDLAHVLLVFNDDRTVA